MAPTSVALVRHLDGSRSGVQQPWVLILCQIDKEALLEYRVRVGEQANSPTNEHDDMMADRKMMFLRDLLADLEQIKNDRPGSQT